MDYDLVKRYMADDVIEVVLGHRIVTLGELPSRHQQPIVAVARGPRQLTRLQVCAAELDVDLGDSDAVFQGLVDVQGLHEIDLG